MNIFESTFEKHKKLVLEADEKQDAQQDSEKKSDKVADSNVDASFKENFWKDFKSMSVVDFHSKYKDIVSDKKVKTFISAGIEDRDSIEKFKVEPLTLKLYDGGKRVLIPTQNEIGFGNSLNDIISGQYASELSTIMNGTNVLLGSPAGTIPLITFAGRYIIDGHHRWSKICCANPNATVQCLNFTNSELGEDPQLALKAFHLAIATNKGSMPTEPLRPPNLIESSPEAVKSYVEKKLEPAFLEIYNKYKEKIKTGVDTLTNKDVAEYIARNAQVLIIGQKSATETPRLAMPQVDKPAQDALTTGKTNFAADKLTENAFESTFKKYRDLYTK